MIRTLAIIVSLTGFLSVALGSWVYQSALNAGIQTTKDVGNVRLNEASNRLRGQLDFFRALVNLIAQDTAIQDAMRAKSENEISELMKDFALTYGAEFVDLVAPSGRIIGSSRFDRVGKIQDTSLVQAALNGRLGFLIKRTKTERIASYSRSVPSKGLPAPGLVVVGVNIAQLEFEWPVIPEPIIFYDNDNQIISTNRLSLLERSAAGLTSGAQLPNDAIQLDQDIPQLSIKARIYLDTSAPREAARLRILLFAALVGVTALIGAVLLQQRRRLALEEQHNATLEARVENRTAALREAQDELVETSKLAALGRLSAGVSHELNQPLSAILNYSENGQRFIAKDRTEDAASNFFQISEQVRRITRIIGNLRAFARQEVAATDEIDFAIAIQNAVSLAEEAIQAAEIDIKVDIPDRKIIVVGGQVRLEQVVMNLLNNAIDALSTSATKKIFVSLTETDDQAVLTVRDTGPGIKDPDQVFEPFYTTKELGASKGMGLGLALSYGIISRFGGQLTCQNEEDGAVFTIILPVVGAAK